MCIPKILLAKKIILCSSYYLAAAISSQTVKHERGVTSGNHEAIMASKCHCIYFALIRSASPVFFLLFTDSKNAEKFHEIIAINSSKRWITASWRYITRCFPSKWHHIFHSSQYVSPQSWIPDLFGCLNSEHNNDRNKLVHGIRNKLSSETLKYKA